jgi:P27 family predicted phage terminase small subunit
MEKRRLRCPTLNSCYFSLGYDYLRTASLFHTGSACGLAHYLHGLGIISELDRAALAAYCQAYGRWVEAEKKLKETPALLRTPAGYVQPSPWLAISNKNVELMHKFMCELGLSPVSRSRVTTTRQITGT